MKDNISDFAPVALKLLQGVLYEEDVKSWRELEVHHSKLKRYFAQIGLQFHFDEKEGYAYLSQPEESDEDILKLPRLIRKRWLSYEVTLLLVVLREILDDFDADPEITTKKCFTTQGALRDKIQRFFRDKANHSKLLNDLDKYIVQVVDLGFLRLNQEDKQNISNNQYELKRIIRAKVTLDDLEAIKAKLIIK